MKLNGSKASASVGEARIVSDRFVRTWNDPIPVETVVVPMVRATSPYHPARIVGEVSGQENEPPVVALAEHPVEIPASHWTETFLFALNPDPETTMDPPGSEPTGANARVVINPIVRTNQPAVRTAVNESTGWFVTISNA